MTQHAVKPWLSALSALGYEIAFDQHDDRQTVRCVVSCQRDAWEGVGARLDHAFFVALRKAFPSAGAWALLHRHTETVEGLPVADFSQAEPPVRRPPVTHREGTRRPRRESTRGAGAAVLTTTGSMRAPTMIARDRSKVEPSKILVDATGFDIVAGVGDENEEPASKPNKSQMTVDEAIAELEDLGFGDEEIRFRGEPITVTALRAKVPLQGSASDTVISWKDDDPDGAPLRELVLERRKAPKSTRTDAPSALSRFPNLAPPKARPKPASAARHATAAWSFSAASGPRSPESELSPLSPDWRPSTKTGARPSLPALQRLERVLRAVNTAAPNYCTHHPDYIRLQFSLWAAEARSIQESHGAVRDVRDGTRHVVQALSGLCARWWPGSLSMLRRLSTPDRVLSLPESLRVPSGTPEPKTWVEAHALMRKIAEGAPCWAHKGWSDNDACATEGSCELALNEAQAAISLILGVPRREWRDVESIDGDRRERLKVHRDTLLDALRSLRSIRQLADLRPEDAMRWGDLMGRMRWISRYVPGNAFEEAAWDAGPPSPPGTTWGDLVADEQERIRRAKSVTLAHADRAERERERAERESREAEERERLKEALICKVPAYGAPRLRVREWLTESFPVLTNPEIAEIGFHLRSTISSLGADDFDERSMRSRIRKLHSHLHAMGTDDEEPPPAPAVADPASVSEDTTPDPVLLAVRAKVEGRRTLVVSNRKDPLLAKKLNEMLGLDATVYPASTARKVASCAQAIAKGRYEMVLMLTSFNSHTADKSVSKAAKSKGIPHIRVGAGRPLACAVAIAKALGIEVQDSAVG